jgi:hypothetical protein
MAVAPRLKPTSGSQASDMPAGQASIELCWLPLGAGGWFVKANGRIWEAIHALLEGRRPLDLYHSALVVELPEGRFVIENCWPIPDAAGGSRGVAVQGPVASRRMARFRLSRYSVIAWLLARSGLPTEIIRPPAGGRAPGWQAGLTVAYSQPPTRSGTRQGQLDRSPLVTSARLRMRGHIKVGRLTGPAPRPMRRAGRPPRGPCRRR